MKNMRMITKKLCNARTMESNSIGRNMQRNVPISSPIQFDVWLIPMIGPLILTVDISDKKTPMVIAPIPIPIH